MSTTAIRHSVKVGAIFVSSWGYDQTNIDFYQVVAVTPASVRIRRIAAHVVSSSHGQDLVEPLPDNFMSNEVLLRRVKSGYRGEPWIDISDYAGASLYESPRYQTAAGWGH